MSNQHYVFLSPHFDDVALSCGGLVWDLVQNGCQVEIWTLMGGLPPDENFSEFAQQNHQRWGLSGKEAIRMRRAEAQAACQVLGALPRHFNWPDAIYRRDPGSGEPLVINNETLFGTPPEAWLVEEITDTLLEKLPEEVILISPAGIGHHIDHLTVAQAAYGSERKLFFYADYPYILKHPDWTAHQKGKFIKRPHGLNEDALDHWQDAVLAYSSQISDFWQSEEALRLAYQHYMSGGGGRLWEQIILPWMKPNS